MTRALAWCHGISLGAAATAFFCGDFPNAIAIAPIVLCTGWALVLGGALREGC